MWLRSTIMGQRGGQIATGDQVLRVASLVDLDPTENDYEPWFPRFFEKFTDYLWVVGYFLSLSLASKRG